MRIAKLTTKFTRAVTAILFRAALGAAAIFFLALTLMRWVDPVTTAVIARENLSAEFRDAPPVQLRWRELGQMSPQLPLAAVAAEDQRFFAHYGFDFVELRAALRARGRLRGASTISQQVAKNIFLWRGRSYLRKLLEAPLAFCIDRIWGKRRVLEVYLNVAQFGPRIYGVENASLHYYGKSARHLTRGEAARLVSVLPSPKTRSPLRADSSMQRRWQWIVRHMRALESLPAFWKL